MKRFFNFLAFAVLVSAAHADRPDLNAFLNRKAISVPQLVNQVQSDPAVMDRYQRHFAMSRSEVVAYLKNLHLARLTRPGVFAVYSVPDQGFIKVHTQFLKAGTPIYAEPFGAPILLVKCGNPLTRGPKSPEANNELAGLLINNSTEGLRELTADFHQPPYQDLFVMQPELPDVPLELITANEQPIPIIIPTALNFGPLLGLLGGGVVVGTIGHTDGGNTAVPEPAAYLALTIGFVPLLRRRKR